MSVRVAVSHAVRGGVLSNRVGESALILNAFWFREPEPQYFLWGCPTCGGLWSGWLAGPKPSPFGSAWTLSGPREAPSLSPSLVCAMARPEVHRDRQPCTGHFWLRDGLLV